MHENQADRHHCFVLHGKLLGGLKTSFWINYVTIGS